MPKQKMHAASADRHLFSKPAKCWLPVVFAFSILLFPEFLKSPVLGQTKSSSNASSTPQLEIKTEVIAENLNLPFSVAIQPETGFVFVAESGAGRIISVQEGKPSPVIQGFPIGKLEMGAEPKQPIAFPIGPSALQFETKSRVLVGSAGLGRDQESVFLFDISKAKADAPIKLEDAISRRKLNDKPKEMEWGFTDLAVVGEYAYLNCFKGDPEVTWIARTTIRKDNLVLFRRFAHAKFDQKVGRPMALEASPEGHVLAGFMGQVGEQGDSSLWFIETNHGDRLIDYPLGPIRDVIDFAYRADGNTLFALDHDFSDPDSGGLFQLVTNTDGTGCKAIKLLDLKSPTSMAFGPKGNLYVTLAGKTDAASGKLIKIYGLPGQDKK